MAYKSKVDAKKYKNIFPTRLREIMESHNCTTKELAENIKVTPQAVGAYCRGETMPKLEFAQAIADYFKISLDYLSGSTDVAGREENIHITHQTTGLSELAIQKLQDVEDPYGIINELLENDKFYETIDYIVKSIDVQESSLGKFSRELSTDICKTFGIDANLTTGFTNANNDEKMDDAVAMISMLAPNRIALTRTEAAKFYLQEAQNSFRKVLDEITKEKPPQA